MSLDDGSGPAVTFGLFDWIDADGVRDAGQLYRERLDLLHDAESHGFDVYHLAEHHGTPLGLAPSPNVFLAAAAMRTTRIRLCPLLYVLPLYHPTRLRASGCNHFAGAFAFGSLSYAEASSSLARFGEEVAPALRGLAPG